MFRTGLVHSKFQLLPSEGSHFQCFDYSAFRDASEAEFCHGLPKEIGVAAIPLLALYEHPFQQKPARCQSADKDCTVALALLRF